MKTICMIILSSFLAALVSGCGLNNDMFGATDRARIRANADIVVAEARRDEAVGVAHETASASRAWAGTLPIVILIVVVGAVIALTINWQGRIHFEHIKQMATQPGYQMLPEPTYIQIPAAVQHKAAEVGGSIELRGGQWCIIHDDGRVLRARLIERKD